MDEYKDVENCGMFNPCEADPRLCLTVCELKDV